MTSGWGTGCAPRGEPRRPLRSLRLGGELWVEPRGQIWRRRRTRAPGAPLPVPRSSSSTWRAVQSLWAVRCSQTPSIPHPNVMERRPPPSPWAVHLPAAPSGQDLRHSAGTEISRGSTRTDPRGGAWFLPALLKIHGNGLQSRPLGKAHR